MNESEKLQLERIKKQSGISQDSYAGAWDCLACRTKTSGAGIRDSKGECPNCGSDRVYRFV